MKTFMKVILIGAVMLILMAFAIRPSAAESVEYIVTEDGEEYILSGYSGNSIEEIVRDSELSKLTEHIGNLNLEKVRVVFVGVVTDKSLEISKGEYTVCGSISFTAGASLTVSGANVILTDVSLNFEQGSLRVKNGEVHLSDGAVKANTTCVRLDYSADAIFSQAGGCITAKEGAAIKLNYGRCILEGGEVKSENGVAVESKSTLTLSGTPSITGKEYDIITNSPITLSNEEKEFSSAVKIKYNSVFDLGSISCVFYEATAQSLTNVSLYDMRGESVNVRYFFEYEGVGEKNFGAVYLPHTVNFYCDTELINAVEVLSGQTVTECAAKEKSGYEFSSWSIDANSEIPYDFAQNVNKSFDLYAKYTLLSPKFVLNSFEFTYDALEHEFGIEELSHPLLEDGVVNYTWYCNDSVVSNVGPKFNLRYVNESGKYKCKIDFTFGTDTATVTTTAVDVLIHKRSVQIPKCDDKVYTGNLQKSDIASTSIYTVFDDGGIVAGVYPVKIELCDSQNYEFEGGAAVVFSQFSIIKAENRFTDEIRVFDIYEGMMPSAKATALFGEVEYLYSKEYDTGYSAIPPTSPGAYYCVAFVAGSENYTELYSHPIPFSVEEERLTGISIESLPKQSDYTAFEKFNPEGLILSVTYNSKRTELVSADKLDFSYQTADSLRYGDRAVIAKYLELSIPVTVTVRKAKYDISGIVFSDTELVYDGNKKSIAVLGDLPMGLDGITLGYSVVGGGVDVGDYPVTLTFSTNSPNYEIPPEIIANLKVLPYASEVVFINTEFVYDGSLKCPEAYYTDVYGRKIALTVSGSRSLAGKYTAEAVCNDKNYELLNPTVSYSIAKANYDLSTLQWNTGDFIYDGVEKGVSLTGLPQGVTIIGYSNNKATAAGKYMAGVALAYDVNNYNPPGDIYFEWEIKRADYDLSLFGFSDSELVYNGKAQYPAFYGSMPVGIDGIPLEYKFSGGATHVAEGNVMVEIIFATESRNYNLPKSIFAHVKILPLGISVVWQNTEFTYNGNSHAPTAIAKECQVSVVGAIADAGSHTATAVSQISDYYLINPSVSFIINKAKNKWTSQLKIQNLYEGREISPEAVAVAGEVIFLYYSDAEAKCEINPPSLPGKYYARAYSPGDNNHEDIISEIVEFEIIKVVAKKMHILMHRYEFFAFEKLDFSDFSVKIENNDGSLSVPSESEVSVTYISSDSLRFGDGAVLISCMGFTEEIAITVSKADYDMSGVFWTESSFEFDGEEKKITLSGLPLGVSVSSYVGGVGKYVGEYPAEAFLEYDTYNYNQPSVPPGLLNIRKRVIEVPVIDPVTYNGMKQYPNIPKSDIYFSTAVAGDSVGVYGVTFKLCDSLNYEFSGALSEVVAYYEILPRKITVRVTDVDKYLFESINAPVYVIEEGYVIEGDELGVTFVYSDDKISCISDNENYLLTVIDGKIIRHKSLSDDGFFFALLILLLLLTLLFVLIVILSRKDRIRRYISILKCRFSPIEKEAADAGPEAPVITSDTSSQGAAADMEDSIDTSDTVDLQTDTEAVGTDEEFPEDVTLEAYNNVENALRIDRERADDLITDSLAKDLLTKNYGTVETDGTKKRIINVDTLSENFSSGDTVDVNILKSKSLIPYDTAYIKVLARGIIDKPLKVYANDFSLSAIKMIALTGGEAIRVISVKRKENK